jgi:hypothetical protein
MIKITVSIMGFVDKFGQFGKGCWTKYIKTRGGLGGHGMRVEAARIRIRPDNNTKLVNLR